MAPVIGSQKHEHRWRERMSRKSRTTNRSQRGGHHARKMYSFPLVSLLISIAIYVCFILLTSLSHSSSDRQLMLKPLEESYHPGSQPILEIPKETPAGLVLSATNHDDDTTTNNNNTQAAIHLPPLESLVHNNKIIGNVSFLLDAAIVGFAKCGTSTLAAWLEAGHPHHLKSIPGESFALLGDEPSRLSTWLWNLRHESLRSDESANANANANATTTTTTTRAPPKQFYKQPKDAYRPQVLQALQQHWPRTKLIYTVRHPVEWFESYWNFRYRNAANKPPIPNTVIGRKGTLLGKKLIYEPIHTGLGDFHVFMAMLGKTAQQKDAAEWALLKPFLKPNEWGLFPFPKTSHSVFLIDAAQLSDTNTTRLSQLQHDLSHFLELVDGDGNEQLLSLPIPHIRPETSLLNASQLQHHHNHRFDICLDNDRYRTLRAYLVWMGAAASQWLREYFMSSPDVSYSSVDHSLEDILASWSKDPCEERRKAVQTRKDETKAFAVVV